MKITRQLALAVSMMMLMVVASGQNPGSDALPAGSATLVDFGSDLTLHSPDGASLSPARGMVLAAETIIDTGKGSALLNLQDGSQLLVKAHSHVVLKAPNQGAGYALELTIGRIVARVKKRLGNAPSFRMGTPTAVITVRGTRFQVEVDKRQRTSVEVYEGIVEVRGLGVGLRGAGVMLRPGYMTHVEANRNPDRAREIEREEGINVGPGGIGRVRTGPGSTGAQSHTGESGEDEEGPH